MIIDPDSYPRNRLGTGIKTTCRVIVACDCCEKQWTVQYSSYMVGKKLRNYGDDFCQSCKNRKGISGMKGQKHSNSTKKKLSLLGMGSDNNFYGKTHSDKQKKKWSVYRTGRPCRTKPMSKKEKKHRSKMAKRYWNSLTKKQKEDRISKMDMSGILKRALQNGGSYSKLHKTVKNSMDKLGFNDFESEEKVGRYIVDEVSYKSKVIIEINGDYWHANPKKYDKNQLVRYPKGDMIAKDVWKRDHKRINNLKALGFRVYVIWEMDVKTDKYLKALKKLKNIIKAT